MICNVGGVDYDVDWTNRREGKGTEHTYAASTARSHHNAGVGVAMLDGSIRFAPNTIDLDVWRALSTRDYGEVFSNPLD